jgi:hypothetical protein
VYEGDRALWIARKLEDYPVFAKEGAIIPLDAAPEPGNGERNPDGFEILVVVGEDGAFELLEDDGTGSSAEEANLARTPIKYSEANGTVTIGPSTGPASHECRGWTIRFLALHAPEKINIVVDNDKRDVELEKVSNGILVHIGKVFTDSKITITLGSKPQLRQNDVEALVRPIIFDAQISFVLKDDIWQIVTAKIPTTLKVSRLQTLQMDENLRNAVLEYLLAN